MFNLNTVEVGDVWRDQDGDTVTIANVYGGRYAAWYIRDEVLKVDSDSWKELVDFGTLISRGGVDYREFEHAALYPVKVVGASRIIIRSYDACNGKFRDFDGNPHNISNYVWIGKKIEVEESPNE